MLMVMMMVIMGMIIMMMWCYSFIVQKYEGGNSTRIIILFSVAPDMRQSPPESHDPSRLYGRAARGLNCIQYISDRFGRRIGVFLSILFMVSECVYKNTCISA